MTALAAIAAVSAAELFENWQTMRDVIETGSVITATFGAALEKRMGDLSVTQAGRVKKVIKQVSAGN